MPNPQGKYAQQDSAEYTLWLRQQKRQTRKSAPIPDAPTGLAALASVGFITVSWPLVPGFVVNLYRSEVNDFSGSSKLKSFISAIEFVDTNVVATTTYYYWLTSSNDVGESLPSTVASEVAQ